MAINKTLGNIFKGDKVIWMIFFFLCIISAVEVFSASSALTYKSGSYLSPLVKHVGILLVGIVCMLVTLNVQCRFFRVLAPLLLVFSAITLLWVLFAGSSTNDAQRWISLFGIQFQPSELGKGSAVLTAAQILALMQTDKGAHKRAFWYIMCCCMPIVALIAFENLSTAALLFVVLVIMMFLGRVPASQLGKLMGIVAIFAVLVVSFVLFFGHEQKPTNPDSVLTEQVEEKKPEKGIVASVFHRADTWKSRIYKFMNKQEVPPEKFDLDKDAQVGHANIAIASSGIIGRGPGKSVERDFLSQAFSDFIYAVIIEELGIIGAVVVAMLYVILLFRAGIIAHRCENNFPALLIMGLALLLVMQALFNMCVAVGLVPVTGQPLPLISKGGTSTIINCIYVGAMLSVSRTAKKTMAYAGNNVA